MMEQQKKAIVFPLRNAGEYIEKENEMARGKIDFTKMDNIKFIEEVAEGFKIEYDEDEDFFSVYDEQGEDITDELEDTLDLKSTMRSIFWYATSRY